MIARRAVWTDTRVRELLTRFVPAADEVGFLQRVKSEEGELFRKVAEQGHYAGRTTPTSTRQGLYATTADGQVLGAMNHNDPARVAAMLEAAWAKWESLSEAERAPRPVSPDVAQRSSTKHRLEARYPKDGMVLRITSRDLPREEATAARPDWRQLAWNLDNAWFRGAEEALLVPTSSEVGASVLWPEALTDRLLRVHLVDNVRGQTYPVKADQVRQALLRSAVVGVEQGQLFLRIDGEVHWEAAGNWRIGGSTSDASPQERGLVARLLGHARVDIRSGKFSHFEAVVAGTRWGATQYNGRHDDLGPAPIGYVIELAAGAPQECVAPANIWEYRGY